MVLLPPFLGWSRLKSLNLDAASNPNGTTITASATANQKGAWTQLSASCPFDADGFMVLNRDSTGELLLDIGIGGAGSERVILPDLHRPDANLNMYDVTHPILVPIPAGSRVAARCQGFVASADIFLHVLIFSLSHSRRGILGQATAYGVNTGDSGGTSVDPGGTANTKGAWVELASAAAFKGCRQLLIAIGDQRNTALTSGRYLFDIGIGGAGSEIVVIPDIGFGAHATTDSYVPYWFGFNIGLPAGVRVAARGQSSVIDATDRLFDISLIGVN